MQAKNEISDRFLEAYAHLQKSGKVADKKDFAQEIGISTSMMTEIHKGRSNVGVLAIQNIVTTFHVNADWLLTGQGDMFKSEHRADAVGTLAKNPQEGIPLIPASAMAGALSGDIAIMDYECERYVVPAFAGADFLIRVKGDSMTPTYLSGDIVACKRVPLTDIFFQWNKAYILDTNQGGIIKRVKPGSDAQHIRIISDNAAYDPFELPISQIYHIALVIGIIRLE